VAPAVRRRLGITSCRITRGRSKEGGYTGSNPLGLQVRVHFRRSRGRVAPRWPRGVQGPHGSSIPADSETSRSIASATFRNAPTGIRQKTPTLVAESRSCEASSLRLPQLSRSPGERLVLVSKRWRRETPRVPAPRRKEGRRRRHPHSRMFDHRRFVCRLAARHCRGHRVALTRRWWSGQYHGCCLNDVILELSTIE